jgi:hypothetical protein
MDGASLVFEHAVALGVEGCDGEAAGEGVAELLGLAARDRRRREVVLYRLGLLQPGADTDLAQELVRQAVRRAAVDHGAVWSWLGAARAAS